MTTNFNPVPETGIAQRNPDPYNTQVPAIGVPNLEPKLLGQLGTTPRYLPKDESWPWVYGS